MGSASRIPGCPSTAVRRSSIRCSSYLEWKYPSFPSSYHHRMQFFRITYSVCIRHSVFKTLPTRSPALHTIPLLKPVQNLIATHITTTSFALSPRVPLPLTHPLPLPLLSMSRESAPLLEARLRVETSMKSSRPASGVRPNRSSFSEAPLKALAH